MHTLHTLLFALIIGVGYLFFFHSESAPAPAAQVAAVPHTAAPQAQPSAAPTLDAHDPFKESLDRAHAVVKQMNDAHAEANSL